MYIMFLVKSGNFVGVFNKLSNFEVVQYVFSEKILLFFNYFYLYKITKFIYKFPHFRVSFRLETKISYSFKELRIYILEHEVTIDMKFLNMSFLT